ncbi:MAG: membrane protein insertase YidC [Bacteroidales bacterium]|nr:membrane protein insertase YidC [Bacteroidales bacterium]
MNKNTFIGMLLIGAILIGFSIYNSKQFEKQKAYQMEQDSIAQVRALEYAAEMAAKAEAEGAAIAADPTKGQYSYTYKDSLLEAAHRATAEIYTLENDKIKADYTTRGGQVYQVEIKDYYTYDSLALNLVKGGQSDFGVEFYSHQMINTKNFTYSMVSHNDSSLVMRLNFDEDSYIEHIYSLPSESYLVNFDFRLVNMEQYISQNATQFDVDWRLNIPRLEKGYDNERNYSTIDYRYPGDEVENLGLRRESSSKEITTKISWFAFQQQFFSAILRAKNDFTSGNLSYAFFKENDHSKNLMQCHANMEVAYNPEGSVVTIPFEFYFGPNHFRTLRGYDQEYEKIIPLGGWLVNWINRIVIIPTFDFLSKFIGNFGIIILLMTIMLKIVISPFTIKSFASSAKMRVIKPEIDKINAKYPKQEDALKKQQAMQELYKASGVSMFGGCLPMLFQFPILFAMFRFFPASIELRQQSFLWVDDLSAYDSIIDLPFKLPLYGDHVSLFAILVAVTMYFYSKAMLDQQGDNANMMPGMKAMQLYFMPIMMLFICNNLSSALSYYYMLSNLITMGLTWVIRKFFVDEEKILAQIQASKAKAKTKPKSKFQQRLEEAAKAQQEMLKQQQAQQRRK